MPVHSYSDYVEVACSLRLEHEEGLVVALEQVEEQDPRGLVREGGGERLAADNVPSRRLVLQFGSLLDGSLNLSRQLLVELGCLGSLIDHYVRKTAG